MPCALRLRPSSSRRWALSAPLADSAFGDLPGEVGRQAAALVDRRELAELALGVFVKLSCLHSDVGLLGVALRADRDVFAGCHRQGSRDEPGDAGCHHGARRLA